MQERRTNEAHSTGIFVIGGVEKATGLWDGAVRHAEHLQAVALPWRMAGPPSQRLARRCLPLECLHRTACCENPLLRGSNVMECMTPHKQLKGHGSLHTVPSASQQLD